MANPNQTDATQVVVTSSSTTTPQHNDILLGRGHKANTHSGNKILRDLVKERLEEYMTIPYRGARETVVRQVMEEITQDGGKFLKPVQSSGGIIDEWHEVDKEVARAKVLQLFRDYAKQASMKEATSDSPAVREAMGKLSKSSMGELRPTDLPDASSSRISMESALLRNYSDRDRRSMAFTTGNSDMAVLTATIQGELKKQREILEDLKALVVRNPSRSEGLAAELAKWRNEEDYQRTSTLAAASRSNYPRNDGREALTYHRFR